MASTTKPVINPTPKTRFQESGQNIGSHRDMVDSQVFQRAIDFAVMEYTRQLATNTAQDSQRAAVNGFKQAGAMEFIDVLRNLSESPAPMPPPTQIPQLNHRA